MAFDAQSERHNHRGGEPSLVPQDPDRVSKVLPPLPNPLRPAGVAQSATILQSERAAKPLGVAEARPYRGPGLLRRETPSEVVALPHVEVEADFVVHIGPGVGAEEAEVAPPERLTAGTHQTRAGLREAGAFRAAKTACA